IHLTRDEFLQRLRAARLQVHAQGLGELLAHVGVVEDLDELGVKLVDDWLGRARGRENPPPRIGRESRKALLGERRYVGHDTRALLSGDRERTQLPAL